MKGKNRIDPFPYTDLTGAKLRPALVIFEGKLDLIVAFKTGLKVTSVLKLAKISTIRKDLAEGILGELESDLKDESIRS